MGEAAEQLETIMPPPTGAAIVQTSTSRATILRASIEADDEQRQLLKAYIERHMVERTDYGVIPGTDKPTLLKPGAEKLVDLFRAEPHYSVDHRIEDWDKPLFHYEFRCVLKDRTSGVVYAEGFGSCNSMEGRYRWRKGERLCPKCGQPAIIKSKFGGDGWYCFPKKDGCGEKFAPEDPSIVDQHVGRIENDDIYTLVNTILKMAKKRALVDAAIALARCSDIFTQDVEDFDDDASREESRPRQREQRRSDPPPAKRQPGRGSRDASKAPSLPYGNSKGKAIDDPRVPVRDLEWMAGKLTESIKDPSKHQYHDANKRLLEALQVEVLRRGQGAAHGNDEQPPLPEDDDIPY